MTELQLNTLTEDELHNLLNDVRYELAAREKQRKADATARIRQLADAAGLTVAVKDKPFKKRGRPSKPSSTTKARN
jgi:hypothetical protein